MKFLLLLLLPAVTSAGEPVYECAGKTHFVHRGAQSTTPTDERRSYRIAGGRLEGLACEISERQLACHGLTPQQAYRRVVIDRSSNTVSDTLEMPTSMLIFEGSCT
jgi:hypothetical protein